MVEESYECVYMSRSTYDGRIEAWTDGRGFIHCVELVGL